MGKDKKRKKKRELVKKKDTKVRTGGRSPEQKAHAEREKQESGHTDLT